MELDVPGQSAQQKKHPCPIDGCGKSFLRKEHLTRHERTHNPETLLVCKVCGRKFNRSDSLLRHLTRHGDAHKPSPSGRSKRACFACHSAKIKCDGNQQCATCLKKGIACRYRQEDMEDSPDEDQDARQSQSAAPSSHIQLGESAPMSGVLEENLGLVSKIGIRHYTVSGSQFSSKTDPSPVSFSSQSTLASFFTKGSGAIDWSTVQVRSDPPESQDTVDGQTTISDDDPFSTIYCELYFTYFHHRWSIVHKPTIFEDNVTPGVISSIKMIGAWLAGRDESQQYALNMHENIMSNILPLLSQTTSYDTFDQSLSLDLCQTALLNIIFSLYSGLERLVSRAVILRSILVAALREVGLFKSEIVWPDEKPGYFYPLHMVKLGQRQRITAYLFKIDTYFNILRGHPLTLQNKELHYPLPTSFGMWHTTGLDVWEERQAREPVFRAQKPISHMIHDSTWDSEFPTQETLLIEDLQLCICALQSTIWRLSERVMDPKESDISIVIQKDSFRRRLDALKRRLDLMADQDSESVSFGDEKLLPLRYYFGVEDQSQPLWQNEVISRVKSLFFDSAMLYHLFSLHLLAEVGMLTQLAKEQSSNITYERQQISREQRLSAIRRWSETPTARQALVHAVDILTQHEAISDTTNQNGPEKDTLDPIAYVALSVGALIVWAFSRFSGHTCDFCGPTSRMSTSKDIAARPIIELTNLIGAGGEIEAARDAWLGINGGFTVHLQEIPLCPCNVRFLMIMFRACIPGGWEVANYIAPGVFVR